MAKAIKETKSEQGKSQQGKSQQGKPQQASPAGAAVSSSDATEPSAEASAIALLKQDHRKMEELFRKFEQGSDDLQTSSFASRYAPS